MSPPLSGQIHTLSAFSPADDPKPSTLPATPRLSGCLLKSSFLLAPVPLFLVFLSYHLLSLSFLILTLLMYLSPSHPQGLLESWLSLCMERKAPGADRYELASQQSLSNWFCRTYLFLLHLGFLICKIGIKPELRALVKIRSCL